MLKFRLLRNCEWRFHCLLFMQIIQIFCCFFMLVATVSNPESCELTGGLLPACCDVGHTRLGNSGPLPNPGCCSGHPVGSLAWRDSEVWWLVVIEVIRSFLCLEKSALLFHIWKTLGSVLGQELDSCDWDVVAFYQSIQEACGILL